MRNKMKIDLNSIYVPSDKVVARKIDDEIIIVPIQNGLADLDDAMFSLNETGQIVWEQLSNKLTVKQVCHRLTELFDAEFHEIKEDVVELISRLLEKDLIKKNE